MQYKLHFDLEELLLPITARCEVLGEPHKFIFSGTVRRLLRYAPLLSTNHRLQINTHTQV